jgi:hypothetical protein
MISKACSEVNGLIGEQSVAGYLAVDLTHVAARM